MILCFDIGGSAVKSAHAYATDDVRPQDRVPTPGADFDAFTQVLRDAIALVDPAGGRAVFGLSNDGERGGPACQAMAMEMLRI